MNIGQEVDNLANDLNAKHGWDISNALFVAHVPKYTANEKNAGSIILKLNTLKQFAKGELPWPAHPNAATAATAATAPKTPPAAAKEEPRRTQSVLPAATAQPKAEDKPLKGLAAYRASVREQLTKDGHVSEKKAALPRHSTGLAKYADSIREGVRRQSGGK